MGDKITPSLTPTQFFIKLLSIPIPRKIGYIRNMQVISRNNNSGRHLQSYINTTIANIAGNSSPELQVVHNV